MPFIGISSVPIPKFVQPCGTFEANFGITEDEIAADLPFRQVALRFASNIPSFQPAEHRLPAFSTVPCRSDRHRCQMAAYIAR
ncbi:MAG: hypothetical protein JWN71_4686 [Xanthobacteraceae bacterium]|nr:hypothetical protein [Xanthobacteraceae bacterium]